MLPSSSSAAGPGSDRGHVKPDDDDEETRERRPSSSGSGARLRVVLRCTYCKDALGQGEAVYCALCLAPHHHDCQRAHGRCAAMGCACAVTIRPRSASARQRAAKPRLPAAPRASLVTLPAFLGLLVGVAGLTGSVTAAAVTVGAARHQVTVVDTTRAAPADELPRAAVRLEANGFVQRVLLARGDVLVAAPSGDAMVVSCARDGRAGEAVLSLLPAGPVRLGLEGEPRALDVTVGAAERAAFEVLWARGAALDGPDAPTPRLRRVRSTGQRDD